MDPASHHSSLLHLYSFRSAREFSLLSQKLPTGSAGDQEAGHTLYEVVRWVVWGRWAGPAWDSELPPWASVWGFPRLLAQHPVSVRFLGFV